MSDWPHLHSSRSPPRYLPAEKEFHFPPKKNRDL